MKKLNLDKCAYCGVESSNEKDHIPPKSLFPKPRPSNLITIPCCSKCHRPTSKDDEYFKSMMLMSHNNTSDSAKEVLESVHRSFERDQQRGFVMSIINSIDEIDPTFSALEFGKQKYTYEVDLDRLTKVVIRIIKGLIVFITEKNFPVSAKIKCYAFSGIEKGDLALGKIEQIMRKVHKHEIGRDVFSYQYYKVSNSNERSCFLRQHAACH